MSRHHKKKQQTPLGAICVCILGPEMYAFIVYPNKLTWIYWIRDFHIYHLFRLFSLHIFQSIQFILFLLFCWLHLFSRSRLISDWPHQLASKFDIVWMCHQWILQIMHKLGVYEMINLRSMDKLDTQCEDFNYVSFFHFIGHFLPLSYFSKILFPWPEIYS